ncbi:12278_t:CDS:2, partial [Rhizophagus irregularis]
FQCSDLTTHFVDGYWYADRNCFSLAFKSAKSNGGGLELSE